MDIRPMTPCGVELAGVDIWSASDEDLQVFEKAFQGHRQMG